MENDYSPLVFILERSKAWNGVDALSKRYNSMFWKDQVKVLFDSEGR